MTRKSPPRALRILLWVRGPVWMRYEAVRCGEWVRSGMEDDGRHVLGHETTPHRLLLWKRGRAACIGCLPWVLWLCDASARTMC